MRRSWLLEPPSIARGAHAARATTQHVSRGGGGAGVCDDRPARHGHVFLDGAAHKDSAPPTPPHPTPRPTATAVPRAPWRSARGGHTLHPYSTPRPRPTCTATGACVGGDKPLPAPAAPPLPPACSELRGCGLAVMSKRCTAPPYVPAANQLPCGVGVRGAQCRGGVGAWGVGRGHGAWGAAGRHGCGNQTMQQQTAAGRGQLQPRPDQARPGMTHQRLGGRPSQARLGPRFRPLASSTPHPHTVLAFPLHRQHISQQAPAHLRVEGEAGHWGVARHRVHVLPLEGAHVPQTQPAPG